MDKSSGQPSAEGIILKEIFMVKAGSGLEKYVQEVYSALLKLNDYKNVKVSTNVTITGKSGATNEFDVYYQFQHLNLQCNVVFECKDWNRPVSIKEVREFVYKINDVGSAQYIGVMVSKSGYQDGSQKVADADGIKLLTINQLPTVNDILAGILTKAMFPDAKTKGQPFWTLMETQNGIVNGCYFLMPDQKTIPLFYSKSVAMEMLKHLPADGYTFEVRGLTQYQLQCLINQKKKLGANIEFGIYFFPYWIPGIEKHLEFVSMSAEQLEANYIW